MICKPHVAIIWFSCSSTKKIISSFKCLIRNFFVTVDFKQDEIDNFRISMIDKDINQEQILLRNKDGVYVLTPVLNQVYTFKGDYPLNSPKPYLYHSYVEAIKGKYDVINNADGYTVTFDTNYDNEPNWSKQEIKFSKDLKPVWSYIYDNENNIKINIKNSWQILYKVIKWQQ